MVAVMKGAKGELQTGWLDRLGIGVSAFCLVQCLALPVIVILAPTASAGFLSHELFHVLLLAVILPVSGLAFGLGFARHRNAAMWVPGGIGLGLIVLAAALEQGHVIPSLGVALLTSAGGVGLILGHLANMRAQRCLAE